MLLFKVVKLLIRLLSSLLKLRYALPKKQNMRRLSDLIENRQFLDKT